MLHPSQSAEATPRLGIGERETSPVDEVQADVLEAPPLPSPAQQAYELGTISLDRYRHYRKTTDLETSIAMFERSLGSGSPHHLSRQPVQHKLAIALAEHWEVYRKPDDLDRAAELYIASLDEMPQAHPLRADVQVDLAGILKKRSNLRRNSADWDRASTLYSASLDVIPIEHPQRRYIQRDFAFFLAERWQLDLNVSDLDWSISLCELVLDRMPVEDPERFTVEGQLAWSLLERWHIYHDAGDLDQCIELYMTSLDAMPVNFAPRCRLQHNLSLAFEQRWRLRRDISDLSSAVDLCLAALACGPFDNQEHDTVRKSFERVISTRWRQLRDVDDLGRLVELYVENLGAQPDCVETRIKLAYRLYQRSRISRPQEFLQNGGDLITSIQLLTSAFDSEVSDPQRAFCRRTFINALSAYIKDNGSFYGLQVPLSTLYALQSEEQGDRLVLDVAIWAGLLEDYEASLQRQVLDEAVEVAFVSFSSINKDHPLFLPIVSLVERTVSYLVDHYDSFGRLRSLEQAESLVQLCQDTLSSVHLQHTAFTDGVAKLQSRCVPVLDVAGKERFAVDSGGYCDIYLARLGDRLVALKTPKASPGDEERQKWFLNEIHLWSRVKHRYILELLGIYRENDEVFVISRWCPNGNCLTFIQHNPDFDTLRLLRQVAEALVYLHQLSPVIVHGDIKGENVLIDDNGDALLCDFGLSRLETVGTNHGATQTASGIAAAGTCRFMAPEVFPIEEQEDINGIRKWSKTTKSDVYAFGCLIFQVMTGKPPFSNVRFDASVIVEVIKGRRPSRPKVFTNDELWALCTDCWSHEADSRPTMERVLERLQGICQPE